MENKEEIVVRLKLLLKATSAGRNIEDLILSEDHNEIMIQFVEGGTRKVNIAGDSGYAIIKDVMDKI